MSRRRVSQKRELIPDPRFGSETLARFVNMLMLSGKKSVAESVVYGALDQIQSKIGNSGESLEVLQKALDNVPGSYGFHGDRYEQDHLFMGLGG
jgi:small subunit ribosomal protein S7